MDTFGKVVQVEVVLNKRGCSNDKECTPNNQENPGEDGFSDSTKGRR